MLLGVCVGQIEEPRRTDELLEVQAVGLTQQGIIKSDRRFDPGQKYQPIGVLNLTRTLPSSRVA